MIRFILAAVLSFSACAALADPLSLRQVQENDLDTIGHLQVQLSKSMRETDAANAQIKTLMGEVKRLSVPPAAKAK